MICRGIWEARGTFRDAALCGVHAPQVMAEDAAAQSIAGQTGCAMSTWNAATSGD